MASSASEKVIDVKIPLLAGITAPPNDTPNTFPVGAQKSTKSKYCSAVPPDTSVIVIPCR